VLEGAGAYADKRGQGLRPNGHDGQDGEKKDLWKRVMDVMEGPRRTRNC
jgi:hypothetical protein